MTTLLAIAIDVAVVSLAALLVVAAMRRQSAALRHAVLALALVAAALMPLFELALPTLPILEWPLAERTVSTSIAMSSDVVATDAGLPPVPVSERTSFSWAAMLMAVWVVGLVSVLGRLLRGFVHLARLESRSRVMDTGRWRQVADKLSESLSLRDRVTILQSPDPALLVTYGFRRPKLVVPSDADTWSDERIQMALTHELTHVRRRDATMTLLAAVVCALHWFNPLVWLCARGLRRESECACDDAVLRQGMEPTRYAALLLSVARGHAARRRPWVTAPAIAHPSTLERRIAVMLHRQRNRAPVTRLAKTLVVITAGAIVVPLAAAGIAPSDAPALRAVAPADVSSPPQALGVDPTPPKGAAAIVTADGPTASTGATEAAAIELFKRIRQQNGAAPTAAAPDAGPVVSVAEVGRIAAQAPGNVTGTAIDASGGVVPGVAVRLTQSTLGLEAMTVTDASGRFSFRDVTPGRYELALSLAGFATVNGVLPLDPGTTVTRIVTLPLGTVEETINVSCSAQAANAAPGVGARLGRWWARAVDVVMPVLSAQDAAPMRPVRVGGNIQAPRKVIDVRPVCPPTLVPPTGATVRLVGGIGVDGLIHDVRRVEMVANVELSSALSDSALAAVRQWAFTPTLLNGQPVAVNINIRISYRHM